VHGPYQTSQPERMTSTLGLAIDLSATV
jgi:hypothetical protein